MTIKTAAAAGKDRRQAAISQAARHLYEAETALQTARQSGVGTWISAAYDRLSEAIADHARAVAALQAGAESPLLSPPESWPTSRSLRTLCCPAH